MKMKHVGHVTCVGDKNNASKVVVGNWRKETTWKT